MMNAARWLHLCIKKRSYATHLKSLHVCKDDEQNPLTDKTFLEAVKQFIGFETYPDDYVDHIKPNDLPSTTNEYDFVPPLSSKMVPPIGPKHMLHLFKNCSAISQVNSSFYLQRIPCRKIETDRF
ncbi:dbc561a6-757b-4ecd-8e76-fb8c57c2e731 [Sclerotinia trifoliorum]|uniref:Dbc561a6-757b-4ecd-8e76-fb8c57c2e731 n=1 Tax=Sclerotinia trifoliorum TaxID=28548 RepID=A0A8H2VRA5_9HELO|nr:dbc561a6-757b-4ecd-8e76-fb8c57c2e731 [Sclerotinia trifoliorum]